MKIDITKKEYKLLLDILFISDWIMNAYSVGNNHSQHSELIKKLLSYFQEMDASDQVEFSQELDDYFQTNQCEEYISRQFLEPYEQTFFWDKLIHELAERDALQALGPDAFNKMDVIDRMTKIEEYKKRYQDEFDQNALNNLQIDNNFCYDDEKKDALQ